MQKKKQNSPYFCVFKYARAVKQKVCNEAENIKMNPICMWLMEANFHVEKH